MAVNLTTSMVLNHLKEGLTRNEIGTLYGLNGVQTKILFSHPKLKNRKTIKEKGVAFILVDDLDDDLEVTEEVVEEATEEFPDDLTDEQESNLAQVDLEDELIELVRGETVNNEPKEEVKTSDLGW